MTSEFGAPLSAPVKALSALGTIVLVGEAALFLVLSRYTPWPVDVVMLTVGIVLLAMFAGVALVAIRGYSLEPGVLRVTRPFWSTSHSLAGLLGAARDVNALRFSIYGFGNNGFFAVNGWRRIEPYGWCRVLATDPANAVVLRAPGATYIVTPDRPDEFVSRALALARPAPD